MIFWDFYSAQIYKKVELKNISVSFIRGAIYSQQFLIALSDFTLEVWDFVNLNKGRQFIGHQ